MVERAQEIFHTSSEKNDSSFSKLVKGTHNSLVSNINNNHASMINPFAMEVEEWSQPAVSIQTFVFFDVEASGLRSSSSKSRITELCLVAVGKKDLIEFKKDLTGSLEPFKVTPRVSCRINLCFNPVCLVMPQISDLTGLDNYNLENQNPFSPNTVTLISAFLSHLPKPLCLVAHNGNEFDFPLLKSEVMKTNQNLSDNILVIDSLPALKYIFDRESTINHSDQASNSTDQEIDKSFQKIDWSSDDDISEDQEKPCRVQLLSGSVTPQRMESLANRYDLPITPPSTAHKKQRLSLSENHDRFQWPGVAEELPSCSEVTPDRLNYPQTNRHLGAPVKARLFTLPTERMLGAVRARKRLDFSDSQPPSFSLPKLHEYVFGKAPLSSHGAETDCLSLMRICASKAQHFIDFTEKNAKLFSSVKQMW